jgi:prevent-host-death family protein
MATRRVSITEAKQRLGELVKRAAYGGEPTVLEFRDRPQAAIVSYEDFERMRKLDDRYRDQMAVLERLSELRKAIRRRVGTLPDSAEEIERLREERVDELNNLH